MSNFDQNLDKNSSNFIPLSPITFLERVKDVYPDYESVIYGKRTYTWKQTYERCTRFASALEKQGIGVSDTVSILAANTPELFEAHYSIPMTGAVINTINIRLDPQTISYILEHSDAKLFIVDTQFSPVIKEALKQLNKKIPVIDIVDDQAQLKGDEGERLGSWTYEEFLSSGNKNYEWKRPKDEWQAISLSYTSGTTGKPKGVVYHHRGSYLMSMGSVVAWNMPNRLTYLYTVPMFHCNGWGYPWTTALLNAKVICCRYIVAKDIYNLIDKHSVTHFGGAPIVLNLIANAKEEDKKIIKHKVYAMTAGAPPTSVILGKMEKLGFEVTHVYGLTETYGHMLHCAWNSSWDSLSDDEKSEIKAQQGVRYPNTEEVAVMFPETYKHVPLDGKTIGEIMIRGNIVMKGYYKNKEASDNAMKNGWFHSGDLAVMHPNGYIQIKDRSKDIIISGGENISSVEVENIIAKHDAVSLVAVVAKPDEKWGETPCAFIELKDGKKATEEEIIQYCKENMAGFKRPKHVIFGELPKTSTGKIQKFELRKKAKEK
ncbi:MAG: Long-chain-fatty-acid--CoA ligase [Alphaproteobacteria bacterium MarineAlpha5_Bin11]|nr:MAG: Long-chain-fatty-acid--CoA ligase [Alphaproteobacteria bacterium MarineAlpha5_Bin11]PPR51397.1 MAG: Long-chain-fatty-acid--CoA ligase [Alphaproteobacteria bacterium MarineAlpha5_Bin10]